VLRGARRKYKRGTAKSGKDGKGGRVKSRRQAIVIALSKARTKGKRVPGKRNDLRGSDLGYDYRPDAKNDAVG
jgi:Family of unknown function (DUF6496)